MLKPTLVLALVCAGLVTAQETHSLYTVTRKATLQADGYPGLDLDPGTTVQLVERDARGAVVKVRGVAGALIGRVEQAALSPVGRESTDWGEALPRLLPEPSHPGGTNEEAVTVGDVFAGEYLLEMTLQAATPLTAEAKGGDVLLTLPAGEVVQIVAAPYGKGVDVRAYYVYARGATGFALLPFQDAQRVDPQTVLRRVRLSQAALLPAAEAAPQQAARAGITAALEPERVYTTHAPGMTGTLTLRADGSHGSLQLDTSSEGNRPYSQTYSGALEARNGVLRGRWAYGHSTVIWVRLKVEGETVKGRWQLSKEGANPLRGEFSGEAQ